ncbi:MAG: hypothetical protein AB7F23_01615 [Phycisphaerae bacterium]
MLRIAFLLSFVAAFSFADTITNKETGEVYTGFTTQETDSEKTCIVSREAGKFEADLSNYDLQLNEEGRENKIVVFKIDSEIHSDIETSALEKAIVEESNKGPLAILFEIDTPGGRVDLAKRICSVLVKTDNCKVVAFISGGNNGGAYSAGAAVSMACDNIYMAPGSCIGAATAIISSANGATDMKKVFGETVGEKFGSAWRNYLASLAEQGGRPNGLAKAMAEKDIEILEVQRAGEKLYIESNRKEKDDEVVRVFCPAGTLLTLTSRDALACGMSDGECESRDFVVSKLTSSAPEVVESKCIDEAREELDKVTKRFKLLEGRIRKEIIQINVRHEQRRLFRSDALRSLKELGKNADFLLNLKKKYPDVPVSEEELEDLKSEVDGLMAAMQ